MNEIQQKMSNWLDIYEMMYLLLQWYTIDDHMQWLSWLINNKNNNGVIYASTNASGDGKKQEIVDYDNSRRNELIVNDYHDVYWIIMNI